MATTVFAIFISLVVSLSHCQELYDFFSYSHLGYPIAISNLYLHVRYGAYYTTPYSTYCSLNGINLVDYGVYTTVAMSPGSYFGSNICGVCLELNGTGIGHGNNPIGSTIKVVVTDMCQTCTSFGDMKIGLGGDDNWLVTWKAVPCGLTKNVQYVHQQSQQYFVKLQIRNTNIPVKKVDIIKGKLSSKLFLFTLK
jgi:expansin (peptidoglycan-binding protein)